MLVLAAIALILPAYFQSAVGATTQGLDRLSISISIVLLLAYLLNLVFALLTHRALFAGSHEHDEGRVRPSKSRAISVLAGATVGIAWMSEILVSTIEPATHELGLSKIFVGVFVVAVVGNAVEHATAILAAIKDRMDLSLSIAIGSSVQIALFVTPVLVLASFFIGPMPMDLAFPVGLVLLVLVSVLITAQVANDGRSDWLEGIQLLTIYLVLGLTLFFVPATSTSSH
jgi:Ca2+:H+ antiporter